MATVAMAKAAAAWSLAKDGSVLRDNSTCTVG
jgi:hypothetical protein